MDDLTADQRAKVMRKIRSKDTKAEIMLRTALWHKGYRYRKNWADLPGKPDIVLTKQKICIFIDGEYFHGKDWFNRKEKIVHGNNAAYWVSKIERNMKRDREVEAELTGLGWTVLRFWSRDVEKDPEKCVDEVKEIIFEKGIETQIE